MTLIERLRSGDIPSPSDLLDSLARHFPLIAEMESTPQDPEWHDEGNVRIHTEMVLSEMGRLLNIAKIEPSPAETVILLVGAALHDIGKTITTREEEVDGRLRIISPHHPERGRSYVAPLIGGLGFTPVEISGILGLIRHHHDVSKLVYRNSGQHRFTRLSRIVAPGLLYQFEQCDLRGRICSDLDDKLEILELFRIETENHQLWHGEDPYRAWRESLSAQIAEPEEYHYVLNRAIFEYENHLINSPEEALAKTWDHRRNHCTVTIVSAPSGSGKSTFLQTLSDDETEIISLDAIREELTGRRSDQSKNGQVIQLAKERLRDALRNKRNVLWDTTGLRRDGRAMVSGLAHDYHAATRIVALGVPPETAAKRNRDRPDQVPASVLEKQYRQWQWPDLWEAHQVDHHYF
ncbi:MAG: AAA family ATPase [Verrucomicrobiales bacterium]|nr:AAA family ATPase [Verrucomicrobiales bacterium]